MQDINKEVNPLEVLRQQSYSKQSSTTALPTTYQSDLTISQRYANITPGYDMEDAYGKGQSGRQQLWRGTVKGVAVAGTTFLEGTLGLAYGITSAVGNADLNKLTTNSFSLELDRWNDSLDTYMPNYHTLKERDSKWYSVDNWGSANFWGEQIIKNTGFAVGAFYSGGIITKGVTATIKGISAAAQGITVLRAGTTAAQGGRTAQLLKRANDLETALKTTKAPQQISKINAELKTINTQIRTISKGKDLTQTYGRAIASTHSEAAIEGRFNEKIYLEELTNKYLENHGKLPEGSDLKGIEEASKKLGRNTYYANLALLSVTNSLQYPLLTGAYWRNMKSTGRGAGRTTGKVNVVDKEGKVISRGTKRPADFSKGESYASSKAVTSIGNQMERTAIGRAANRVSPYAKSLFSVSQSFEAGSQMAIPNIFKDYLDAEGMGQDTPFYKSFVEGIKETLNSKEGMNALLSGGISGGLMRNFSSPLTGGRMFDAIRTNRDIRNTTNKFVSEINRNHIGNYVKDMNGSIKRAKHLDAKIEEAIENNDRLEFEDTKTDQELNYLLPRIQYGRIDLVMDEIAAMQEKAKTEEGFQELKDSGIVGKDADRVDYINNLTKLGVRAKALDKSIKTIDSRFGNILDDEGNQVYSKKTMQNMAYLLNKVEDYNNRMPKLFEKFNEHGIDITTLLHAIQEKNLTADQVKDILDYTIGEINGIQDFNADKQQLKEDLGDILEMNTRKQLAIDQYLLIRDKPELYKDTQSEWDFSLEDDSPVGGRAYDVYDYRVKPEDGTIERHGETKPIIEGDIYRTIKEDLDAREASGEDVSVARDELSQMVGMGVFNSYTIDGILNKIENNQPLNEAEQEFFNRNEEAVDKGLFDREQAKKSDKQVFEEENRGNIFDFMGKPGVLEYDANKDILYHVGKERTEVVAQDFTKGRIVPNEPISDSRGFTQRDIDTRGLTVEQARLVRKVFDFYKQSNKRRREVKEEIKKLEENLETNKNLLNDENFSKNYKDRVKDLIEENEVIQEIVEEYSEELNEIQALQIEYQRILDNPSENIMEAIDLLAVEQDMLEDYYKETDSFLGRLQEVATEYGKLLKLVYNEVIQDLNNYIFGSDKRGTPLTDALKKALNLGDHKNIVDLLPQIEGFNIKYAVGREGEVSKRVEQLQLKMSEAYNAKDTVAQQLAEVAETTRDRMKRSEETSKKQEEESQQQQENDSLNQPPSRIQDTVPKDSLQNLIKKEGEVITEDDVRNELPDLSDDDVSAVLQYVNRSREALNELYKKSEKKNVEEVYLSNVLPPNHLKNNKLYQRFDRFLKNRDSFSKEKIANSRMMFITGRNAGKWIGDRHDVINDYYQDELGNPFFKSREESLATDKGGVLIVATTRAEDGSLWFVNSQGNPIKKVDGLPMSDVEYGQLVAWKMPDTDTTFEGSDVTRAYDSDGNVRESILRERDGYAIRREYILNSGKEVRPITSRFRVSRGSFTRGHMDATEINLTGTFVNESDLATSQVIFKVKDEVNVGKSTFTKGETVFVNDENILPVVSRRLNPEEATNIYNGLVGIADNRSSRPELREYISGIVNTNPESSNGVIFGNKNLYVDINGKRFEITNNKSLQNNLTDSKSEILTELGKMNTNVNTMMVNQNNPFTEIIVGEDGNIISENQYASYQNFLLDNTNPKIFAFSKQPVDKYAVLNREDFENMYDVGIQDKGVEAQSLVDLLVSSGKFDTDGKTIIPNIEQDIEVEGETTQIKAKGKKGRPDINLGCK